jgi:hypothetical protein
MSVLSPLRSRRLARQQATPRRQSIAFVKDGIWFALPIVAVEKVMAIDLGSTERDLRSLIKVDINALIFDLPSSANLDSRFLLFVKNNTDRAIAIPLDTPPILRAVADSDAVSGEELELTAIMAKTAATESQPEMYLLDPFELVARVSAFL